MFRVQDSTVVTALDASKREYVSMTRHHPRRSDRLEDCISRIEHLKECLSLRGLTETGEKV